MSPTRRDFLKAGLLSFSASLGATGTGRAAEATQTDPKGFFTVDRRHGRWWFISPDNEQIFSLGLNHVDPATLRYEENKQIWRDKYGNSINGKRKRGIPISSATILPTGATTRPGNIVCPWPTTPS